MFSIPSKEVKLKNEMAIIKKAMAIARVYLFLINKFLSFTNPVFIRTILNEYTFYHILIPLLFFGHHLS